MDYDRSRRPSRCELDHRDCPQIATVLSVVLVLVCCLPTPPRSVTVTGIFVVSSLLFNGYLLHHYFGPHEEDFPRATFNTTFKCQRSCSSSPTAKVCLCRPQPDKSDVYLLPKELDEKVVKWPFPALGTGFKVSTQSRPDYTGFTS